MDQSLEMFPVTLFQHRLYSLGTVSYGFIVYSVKIGLEIKCSSCVSFKLRGCNIQSEKYRVCNNKSDPLNDSNVTEIEGNEMHTFKALQNNTAT